MLKHTYALLMLAAACSISGCKSTPPKKEQKIDIHSTRRAYVDKQISSAYKYNLEVSELKGKISRIEQISYEGAATDTSMPGYTSKEYILFDTIGNITERIVFTGKTLDHKVRYTYSPDNLCTGVANYSPEGKLLFTVYQLFDINGHLLETGKRTPGDVTEIEATCKYDQYGGAILETRKGDVYQYENTYSDDGLLTERTVLMADKKKGKISWAFDSIGNMIEQQLIEADDQVYARSTFAHDAKGRTIKSTVFQKGQPEVTQVISYNALGDVVEQANLDVAKNMKYQVVETIYEYDKQNNWVKAVVKKDDGTVQSTVFRKIEY